MQLLQRLIRVLAVLPLVAGPANAQENGAGTGFTVATWNLQHFPSRNRNLKIPKVEPANIRGVADVLKGDPPDILCLQELRDLASLKKLLRAAEMKNHRQIVISQFNETDGQESVPVWDNVAIITRFPVTRSSTNTWTNFDTFKKLQRGFVFAEVQTPSGPVHVYCTHLKSNTGTGPAEEPRWKPLTTAINSRQGTIKQLIEAMRANGSFGKGVGCILAGDLNTQANDPRFINETTLRQLVDAGLTDSFSEMKREECVTVPAAGGYPDATFDYVWSHGLTMKAKPVIVREQAGSDHRMVRAKF